MRRSWLEHGRLQCKICAQNTGNEKQQNVLLFVEELKKNIENQVAWFLAELCKAGKRCGKKDKRNQCRTELLRGCSAPPLNTPPSSSVERTFFLSSCTWFPACARGDKTTTEVFFHRNSTQRKCKARVLSMITCTPFTSIHAIHFHLCHRN